MIITIDGPTASGKSTVANLLAQRLGYTYINSGLLFRAVAFVLEKENWNLHDSHIIKKLRHILGHNEGIIYKYSPYAGAQIWYKSVNITATLKTPEIDHLASVCATDTLLRDLLLAYQQSIAEGHNVIAEGRDTGTVVFPQAEVKLFITAELPIRAQRWQEYQQRKGVSYSLSESEQHVADRDARDEQRNIAPLTVPEHATIIDSSSLTIEEVVDACVKVIERS